MKLGKSQRDRNKKQVASIAVFKGDLLLFGKRSDDGKWTLPGGHLNPGEDPMNGAYRELYEETGIDFDGLSAIGSGKVPKKDIEVFSFRVDVPENTEPFADSDPDEELVDFKWLDVNDTESEDYDEVMGNLHSPKNITLQLLGIQDSDEASEEKEKQAKLAYNDGYAAESKEPPSDLLDFSGTNQLDWADAGEMNEPDGRNSHNYSPEEWENRHEKQVSASTDSPDEDKTNEDTKEIRRYDRRDGLDPEVLSGFPLEMVSMLMFDPNQAQQDAQFLTELYNSSLEEGAVPLTSDQVFEAMEADGNVPDESEMREMISDPGTGLSGEFPHLVDLLNSPAGSPSPELGKSASHSKALSGGNHATKASPKTKALCTSKKPSPSGTKHSKGALLRAQIQASLIRNRDGLTAKTAAALDECYSKYLEASRTDDVMNFLRRNRSEVLAEIRDVEEAQLSRVLAVRDLTGETLLEASKEAFWNDFVEAAFNQSATPEPARIPENVLRQTMFELDKGAENESLTNDNEVTRNALHDEEAERGMDEVDPTTDGQEVLPEGESDEVLDNGGAPEVFFDSMGTPAVVEYNETFFKLESPEHEAKELEAALKQGFTWPFPDKNEQSDEDKDKTEGEEKKAVVRGGEDFRADWDPNWSSENERDYIDSDEPGYDPGPDSDEPEECVDCGAEFDPSLTDFVCPECGSNENKLGEVVTSHDPKQAGRPYKYEVTGVPETVLRQTQRELEKQEDNESLSVEDEAAEEVVEEELERRGDEDEDYELPAQDGKEVTAASLNNFTYEKMKDEVPVPGYDDLFDSKARKAWKALKNELIAKGYSSGTKSGWALSGVVHPSGDVAVVVYKNRAPMIRVRRGANPNWDLIKDEILGVAEDVRSGRLDSQKMGEDMDQSLGTSEVQEPGEFEGMDPSLKISSIKTADGLTLDDNLFNDESFSQSELTLGSIIEERLEQGRPRLSVDASPLIRSASKQVAKDLRLIKGPYSVESLSMTSMRHSAVSQDGQALTGTITWHARVASHRFHRVVAVDLTQNIVAGEPQAISVISTTAGVERPFSLASVDEIMDLPEKRSSGTRRPNVTRSFRPE